MSAERTIPHPSVSLEHLSVVACGSIIHNDKNQVGLGSTQSNSTFVYDAPGQTTTEVSRNDVVLDPSGDSASVTLGTLVTAGGGQSMKEVIKSSPTSTIISSLQGTSVSNLSIDGSISWDRDESCLYLSANKAFRFKYIESDGVSPSMLVLEGLSATTLEYMPKVEFSSD